MLYLDNVSSYQPSKKAMKAAMQVWEEMWGSPLSPHSFGQQSIPLINRTLEEMKELLGAKEGDRLLFCPSRAVGINTVIQSTFHSVTREFGKNHYLSTQIEEAAQLFCLNALEEWGAKSDLLGVDEYGILTAETLTEGLSPRTALLSISKVNPLLGTIQPMEEVADLCQDRGVLLHVDISASIGKTEINLREWGADFATFSGEMFGAPKGSGMIWVREGVPFTPNIFGHEPASVAVVDLPYLMALSVAFKEAVENQHHLLLETARLRTLFEKNLENTQVLFQANRISSTSVVLFPGVASEALLQALAERDLYAAVGGGTFQQMSHLLQACHIDAKLAHTGISFSFSHHTSEEEVKMAAEIVNEEAKKLKKLSEHLVAL